MTLTSISQAPVYQLDRSALTSRTMYNFRDYGFEVSGNILGWFEVIPSRLTEEECFLFFIARDDVAKKRWSLFNLHIFLKKTGSLEAFARGLGASVRDIPLSPVTVFGKSGLGYQRNIKMGELFQGNEQVIPFLGGTTDQVVFDCHYYFSHRYCHCYTGLLHVPGDEHRYEKLREQLFQSVSFVT